MSNTGRRADSATSRQGCRRFCGENQNESILDLKQNALPSSGNRRGSVSSATRDRRDRVRIAARRGDRSRRSGNVSSAAVLAALIVVWVGGLLAAPPRPRAGSSCCPGLPVLALISARLGPPRRDGRGRITWRATPGPARARLSSLFCTRSACCWPTRTASDRWRDLFAQLRSVIFDRDLDVAAEFAPRPATAPNYVVPVAPTLLWLPLYLVVAAVDTLGRGRGLVARARRRVDRRTRPPLRARGDPLVLCHRGRRVFARAVGTWARDFPRRRVHRHLAPLRRTPLYWYMVYEPSMTHAASFGFVRCSFVGHRPREDDPTPSAVPDARRRCFSARSSASPSSRARRSRSSRCSRGAACSCAGRAGSASGVGRGAARGLGVSWCAAFILLQPALHRYVLLQSRDSTTFREGELRPAALALDRHAVLVVARLPRGRRWRTSPSSDRLLPREEWPMGRGDAADPAAHRLGQRLDAGLGRGLVVRRPTVQQPSGRCWTGPGDSSCRARPAAGGARGDRGAGPGWNHLLMVQYARWDATKGVRGLRPNRPAAGRVADACAVLVSLRVPRQCVVRVARRRAGRQVRRASPETPGPRSR